MVENSKTDLNEQPRVDTVLWEDSQGQGKLRLYKSKLSDRGNSPANTGDWVSYSRIRFSQSFARTSLTKDS